VAPYIFSLVFVLLSLLLSWLSGPLFHLHGGALVLLRTLIMILGGAAAAAVMVLFRPKQPRSSSERTAGPLAELKPLLRDAQQRLASSQRASAKSLDALPLLYLLGESNSAKTTTVLRSGLDPELLAGQIYQDQNVVPTTLANIWYTQQSVLVEAGDAIRKNAGLWSGLIRNSRPKLYRWAIGSQAPMRAAVVCISCETFLGPGGSESSTTIARNTNDMLRNLARQLSVDVPVYVVFTKLDQVPGFAEFVRNLTTEEISQPLGMALPRGNASSGLHADQATSVISSALDRLVFSLGEFRLEMLARESGGQDTDTLYEFPRELQKLRNNLTSCLVELTRPSHLSANPYLRGFYFAGVRSHVSEQAVSTPAASPRKAQLEADATHIFSLRELKSDSASTPPQVVQQKVAQWCFLPKLFPEVILGDRSALSETRSSGRARLLRRTAFATISALLFLWLICLSVSYRNNARLEHTIEASAAALPTGPAVTTSLASTSQLTSLDRLRAVLVQLDDFEQNGPPLMYRWGLYRGHTLIGSTRRIYFDRFRQQLLTRTQQNLLTALGALPATAPSDADYFAAYNPLRAYLITTSFPVKSTAEFLAPVLTEAWIHGERPETDLQKSLAEQQFRFYADHMRRSNPFSIQPVMPTVTHARVYLSSFGGFNRIYQNMLLAAERVAPPIDFNRLFPGSAATVVETHIVPGAFTHDGFAFMQAAMQHPERYFSGELWVLGDQAPPAIQTASLAQQLTTRYAGDFSAQWRSFLRSASVVRYRSLQDARQKLQVLSNPNSSLLELMFTASRNTAVADPEIVHEFQPTQALVPPNSADKLMAPGNLNYINSLVSLQGAVAQLTQDPSGDTNPAATQPVIGAAANAHGAVSQTAQAFNIDPHEHVEQAVISLLQAPITSVEDAVRGQRPAQLNSTGRDFCNNFTALMNKFPFSPTATTEATPTEVTAVLKPETGALWQFYAATLKPFLTQQGESWVAAPTAPLKPTPAFLQFFNRAAALSKALFANGATTPSLSFNAHILPSKEIQSVTLVVDAQKFSGSDVSQQFTWSAQTAQQAQVIANYGSGILPLQFNGIWSLFHLIDRGKLEQPGNPARLAYPLEISNTPIVVNGTPLVVRIELSGPTAALLLPGGLSGPHCVSQVTH